MRPETSSRFYRLGAWTAGRRWVVVALWIIAFLAAGPLLSKLTGRLSQGGFEVPGSQSDVVAKAIDHDFKAQFDLTGLIVFRSAALKATDPGYRALVRQVVEAVADGPGVSAVSDPYEFPQRSISQNGRVATAVIGLTGDQDDALQNAPEIERIVERASRGAEVEALVTGAPSFYREFQEITQHDLERAEKIALPISLLILVVAFGSLVAAGLPLVLALLGLAIAFGIISAIAAVTTVNIFTQNIASMIGIGVGIDYSLFIINRFREELRRGAAVPQAIATTSATSGRAVLVSALTVVVALAGTQLVNLPAFRSMGQGAMIAVAVAGLAALTLLPALLALIGRRIDAVRVGRRRGVATGGGLWHRWAMAVMRRPWVALVACAALLVLLASPVRNLTLGSAGPSILPEESRPRIAAEVVAEAFGEGQVAPAQVFIVHPGGVLREGFTTVYELSRRIARDPEVERVDSIADLAPGASLEQARATANAPRSRPFVEPVLARNGTATLLSVVTEHGAQSKESDAFVNRVRSILATSLPAGATGAVGGDPGLNVDINAEVQNQLGPVVGLVMLLSFLVLLLFFRSVFVALKAILMNLASVLATYGILVFVFQYGHGESLLGFTAQGHVESFLPLFLFCILFGLSMDYEVFLLARIQEEYRRTGDNTEAVGWGLEHTAGIITSAALIMVTVFGAFAFASLVPIKAMGFGLAVAVFLDATLIRVILVPATMRLMGTWNWWIPKWLDRILPKVSIEAAPEPEPAKV